MSDNEKQGPSADNFEGKDQEQSRGSGPETQTAASEKNRTDDPDLEAIAYASDARAVLRKANDIAVALNHTERKLAHVIAAMALSEDAAGRFNKIRLSNGEQLSSKQALQACLEFFQSHVGPPEREARRQVPLSIDVDSVIMSAKESAARRAPEHRRVEISDILMAMAGAEDSELRRLLLGKPLPSLSTLIEVATKIDDNVKHMIFIDLREIRVAIADLRAVLERHGAEFQNVVSAADENRVSTGSPIQRVGDPITSVPTLPAKTVRLKDILDAVEKIGGGLDSRLLALEQKLAALLGKVETLGVATAGNMTQIEKLGLICSKILARTTVILIVAALSGLATIAIIGLIEYR